MRSGRPSISAVLQSDREEGVRLVLCRIAKLEFSSEFGDALLIGSLAEGQSRDEPVHLMLSRQDTEMLADFFAGLSVKGSAVVTPARTNVPADTVGADRPGDSALES